MQKEHGALLASVLTYDLTRSSGGEGRMETIMNVQLVSPAALIATLANPSNGDDRTETLWRKLRARVGEEIRYYRALHELQRLDGRDLDNLNLGRVDLPGLARRHAREATDRV